jgi:hypothetical protein
MTDDGKEGLDEGLTCRVLASLLAKTVRPGVLLGYF